MEPYRSSLTLQKTFFGLPLAVSYIVRAPSMVSGMMRVIRAEQAGINVVTVDYGPDTTTTQEAADDIGLKIFETSGRNCAGRARVLRLGWPNLHQPLAT